MQNAPVDDHFLESLLTRIGEGLVEDVRQEMDRRRRLGIPIYVARNGKIEAIMPNGADTSCDPLKNRLTPRDSDE